MEFVSYKYSNLDHYKRRIKTYFYDKINVQDRDLSAGAKALLY